MIDTPKPLSFSAGQTRASRSLFQSQMIVATLYTFLVHSSGCTLERGPIKVWLSQETPPNINLSYRLENEFGVMSSGVFDDDARFQSEDWSKATELVVEGSFQDDNRDYEVLGQQLLTRDSANALIVSRVEKVDRLVGAARFPGPRSGAYCHRNSSFWFGHGESGDLLRINPSQEQLVTSAEGVPGVREDSKCVFLDDEGVLVVSGDRVYVSTPTQVQELTGDTLSDLRTMVEESGADVLALEKLGTNIVILLKDKLLVNDRDLNLLDQITLPQNFWQLTALDAGSAGGSTEAPQLDDEDTSESLPDYEIDFLIQDSEVLLAIQSEASFQTRSYWAFQRNNDRLQGPAQRTLSGDNQALLWAYGDALYALTSSQQIRIRNAAANAWAEADANSEFLTNLRDALFASSEILDPTSIVTTLSSPSSKTLFAIERDPSGDTLLIINSSGEITRKPFDTGARRDTLHQDASGLLWLFNRGRFGEPSGDGILVYRPKDT